jgi:alkylation response protein AidB-like acyl-CoA dehydrogenase
MDFGLTKFQRCLQQRCLELAADFATRSGVHDRDGSHPTENYDRLRGEGFLELTIGKEWGGAGASFLDHTIAYEALGQGCPSTALAFNMHASVVMPILQSPEVSDAAKAMIAELVVRQHKLIGGNFSEPGTTSLIGERPLSARAKRVDGGYSITGRKMFASMLEAADYVMVMAYPDEATSRFAGMLLLVPPNAPGRRVNANWDTLGMRETRSDSLILEDCRVPESALIFCADDTRRFRHDFLNWFWGSYTAVYLGIAAAAYDELRRVMHTRRAQGIPSRLPIIPTCGATSPK